MTAKKSTTKKKKATDEKDSGKKKTAVSAATPKKARKSTGAPKAKKRSKTVAVEAADEPFMMGPIVTPPKAKPAAVPPPSKEEAKPAPAVSPPKESVKAPKTEEPAKKKAAEAPKKSRKTAASKPAPPPPPPPPMQTTWVQPQQEEKKKEARTKGEAPRKDAKKSGAAGTLADAVTPKIEEAPARKKITFNEMMTVKDLAEAMSTPVTEVIKKLLTLGSPATINQRMELEPATFVADAFGFDIEMKSIYVDEIIDEKDKEGQLKPRPPVVTVMGHVDHGKTSLLDAIRSAKVAEKEAGGITQHIGAYQIAVDKGTITFLDTPGHEAFTAMRARGATATDIVVLVVAADDSVMPQTIEAIDHAKAANVPLVVAINKMDLPTADVEKVKRELSQHNLISEDWGGKTQMVEVSAKTKKNIDKLLEMILLEAEILELKANPDRPARGVVLEAKLDPKRGVTASILVQTGTLKVGDVIVCGLCSGRIRALLNENRKPMESAGPAIPVEILGLTKVPHVGDQLSVVRNDREAREIAERRSEHLKDSKTQKSSHVSLESLHARIAEGNIQELNVILKSDVQGSLQAIQDALGRIATKSVQLRYVHTGVGNINDSDVLLAEASDSIIFGFNVKIEGSAEHEAKKGGVDIRLYNIIYEILADVRAALEGLLKPVQIEQVKGRALIKNVFTSGRFGHVAGCLVQEGKIIRGQKARLLRNGEEVAKGSITSLKRFKEDVREVDKGYECGMAIEGVKKYEANDIIETFVIELQARRLEH